MGRRIGRILVGLIAVVLIAAWVAACTSSRLPPPSGPNVLLIVVDTLRPDFLSCYGRNEFTTTHIDRLAGEGAQFNRAYCQCPATLPSHASMFTSTYTFVHGIGTNSQKLSRRARTLAEILRDAGYKTAGFVSNVALIKKTRIHQGFDHYDDALPDCELNRNQPERTAEKTTAAALEWLAENKNGFFLWVHYQDPHGPYVPPPEFLDRLPLYNTGKEIGLSDTSNPIDAVPNYQIINGQRSVDFYLSNYSGEILFIDQQVGRLLRQARALGALKNTIVVFTSDHGEGMGEHGRYFQHGTSIYEAQLRIPLLISGPGIVPKKVDDAVQSIDVMPTLLTLTGVSERPEMQGEDLAPLLTGKSKGTRRIAYGKMFEQRTFVFDRWKVIVSPDGKRELYDLQSDHNEQSDLSSENIDLADKMTSSLAAVEKEQLDLETLKAEPITDPQMLENLKALGYVN